MAITGANLIGLVSPKWTTAELDEAIVVALADPALIGVTGANEIDRQTMFLAALHLLRRERAKLLARPVSWSAAGDYSENNTEGLRSLDLRIAEYESLTKTGAAGAGITPGLATVGRSRLRRSNRPGVHGTRS